MSSNISVFGLTGSRHLSRTSLCVWARCVSLRCDLLSLSAMRLSTPGTCTYVMYISSFAWIIQAFLAASSRTLFLPLPVVKTLTEPSLSQCTLICMPFCFLDMKVLRATDTLAASSSLIQSTGSAIGHTCCQYAYFPSVAPIPDKHASTYKSISGFCLGIMATPFQSRQNCMNHFRSLRISLLTFM